MKKHTQNAVKHIATFTIVIMAALISQVTIAQSLYISDKLHVPVRKGKGNKYSILHKGLPSGTRVTLIKREKEWTQVRTKGGITGWVSNQFLDSTPPAAIQLVSANKKIEELTNQLSAIDDERAKLNANYQETQQALSQANQLAKKTETELNALQEISSSAIESHQRVQSLAQKMQLLQTENDVLKSENDSLRKSERATFFMYGTFAVLLGILATIIVPRLKMKKRNDGWIN